MKVKFLGVLGTAEIKVTGRFPEKFINMASAQGISMWDTVLGEKELVFKTFILHLGKLEGVQAKSGYALEELWRSGVLVFVCKIWRRKVLLAGFLGFWLVLYYLSGMIWRIDIQGLENIAKEEIEEHVGPLGIKRWTRFNKLDMDHVERQLYLEFPEIAWVALERTGTRISIRIVEKDYDPLQFGAPIDIVAEYDGIISEMMVLQGVPLVEPGMTVAKGDVLISGYREEDGLVNAAGSVKAIVYMEGYGEAALQEVETEFTGNEKLVQILRLGGVNIPLSRTDHGFTNYKREESVRYLRGNSNTPISLVRHLYREVNMTTHSYSAEEADDLARERAKIAAHQKVGEHADILKTKFENISLDAIYRYKVTLTIETKIGKERLKIEGEEIVE